MQKALTQMNVQLDNVLSNIMGKTGQSIIRAIVAGERDGAALAGFRDRRCKADEATIAASLHGNWRDTPPRPRRRRPGPANAPCENDSAGCLGST